MPYELRSARFLAHEVWRQHVKPGDTVIDATMGNGHDTCMLAELVGESGHVHAFDVQEGAIASTAARLAEAGLSDRVTLHLLGHQHMDEVVQEPVALVAFNLGWLPGGDKTVTTLWESTQIAVKKALSLLLPMGVCTVCAYPGHAAGDEERTSLPVLLSALRPQEYNVLHQRFLNAGPGAPECFVIQRQNN